MLSSPGVLLILNGNMADFNSCISKGDTSNCCSFNVGAERLEGRNVLAIKSS